MKRYFNIIKMVYISKGNYTQVTTFENPVELVIDPKNKTFRVDRGFDLNFKDDEITFTTEDNSIIKYRNNFLTIISEKILR